MDVTDTTLPPSDSHAHAVVFISALAVAFVLGLTAALTAHITQRELGVVVAGIYIAAGYYFSLVSPKRHLCPRWVPLLYVLSGLGILMTSGQVVLNGSVDNTVEVAGYAILAAVAFLVTYAIATELDDIPYLITDRPTDAQRPGTAPLDTPDDADGSAAGVSCSCLPGDDISDDETTDRGAPDDDT